MLELPLIFLGGLLGSAHCVGMCGGFALVIGGGARGLGTNLARQVVYSLGRVFTYAALGGALGYAGLRITTELPGVLHVQAVLALVAGALLVVAGLVATGALPRVVYAVADRWIRHRPRAVGPGCIASGLVGSFLREPRLTSVFLAGVFTGFLPCGLVYAFLALACSAGSLPAGAAVMAAFGLGTVPLMILAGSGMSLLSLAMRQRLLRVAAWCVVLTGIVSLARGVAAIEIAGNSAAPACPMCASES